MKFFKYIIIIFVCLLGYGVYYYFIGEDFNSKSNGVATENQTMDRFYKVTRGDLPIGIRHIGTLNSKDKHKLRFEPSISTKLLWVIDEHRDLKKGDLIATFDKEKLTDNIENMEVEIDNIKKETAISYDEKKLLISQNKESITSAKASVVNSKNDLNKYWKFDYPRKKDDLTLKIQDTKSALEKSEKTYLEHKSKMSSTIYANAKEEEDSKEKLEEYKQGKEKSRIHFNNAVLDMKLFKKYTYPNTILTYTNAVTKAGLALEKIKVQTKSSLVKQDSLIYRKELNLKRKEESLEKNKSYLPQMEMKAPVDGFLIYGDPDNRWHRTEIKVGMDIHKKQILFTIPDMSNMVVDFKLPEQYRSKVNDKVQVFITPESMKELRIPAIIEEIATIPSNMIRWDPSSPKIYKTQISLKHQHEKLVNGMSVNIEIITKVLKNVLFIPVESVFDENGKYFVYRKTHKGFKKKSIVIGESSDSYVVIKKGLNKNDTICLYKPFAKKD